MRTFLVLAAVLMSGPALGFEMTDSSFEVHSTVDGEDVAEQTTVVPLQFDNETCWYWYIRSSQLTGEVTFTERLVMPEAPDSWGDLTVVDPEEVKPMRIEDDGKVGVSTRRTAVDDGWFGHGWCVLPGDPVGRHRVEISIEGKLVKRFDFEVTPVEAPEEKAPTRIVRRTDRTGRLIV